VHRKRARWARLGETGHQMRRLIVRSTRVVTASDDNTARVWDAATGKPLTGALEHEAEVVSAAFSPDGTRVVTASRDQPVRLWDLRVDTGTLLDWERIAEGSLFVLSNGVLVRPSELASAQAIK
jgi:WD40 repeat protein